MENGYMPESWFLCYKSKQAALFTSYLNQETRFRNGKHLFPESHAVYLCCKLDLIARWLERPGTIFVITFNRQKACFYYPWPHNTIKSTCFYTCAIQSDFVTQWPMQGWAWHQRERVIPTPDKIGGVQPFYHSSAGGAASKQHVHLVQAMQCFLLLSSSLICLKVFTALQKQSRMWDREHLYQRKMQLILQKNEVLYHPSIFNHIQLHSSRTINMPSTAQKHLLTLCIFLLH